MNLHNVKALAVAGAFALGSSSALADIDFATAASYPISFADELKTLNVDSRVVVTNNGNKLDITGTNGFATTAQVTRFIRFDLTGALFDNTPALTMDQTGADFGVTGALLSGGDANTFAIFSVVSTAADKTIAAASDWKLITAAYQVDPTVVSTITFKMFETATEATNAGAALATATRNFTQHIAGSVPAAAVNASDLTATVASGFGQFAAPANVGAAASGTLGSLGQLDVSDILGATTTVTAAMADTAAADYLTAAQTITITGDVSVGTFTSQTGSDCTGGTIACTKATDNASCAITATAAKADMFFCVTLAADDVLGKGAYTVALGTDTGVAGSLGSVKYDTTTVEVPYITTYEGYNHRIFIDNRGATAAYYSTTFTSESGVTAVAGASGTGTLPANTMSVVKVSDLVTLTGGTRGSATMEVEAQSGSIFVTSQIVDLGTGVTDTQSLHPADNSVGSCTNTISEGTAVVATGTPVVNALAIVNTDGDSSYASQYATNASTAHNASYAYSSCTD
jgi:hypothetical protein